MKYTLLSYIPKEGPVLIGKLELETDSLQEAIEKMWRLQSQNPERTYKRFQDKDWVRL